MTSFSKYKVILWDFDGVILDSMPVRDKGFELVLAGYDTHEVAQLMHFHRSNGGLSRYVKFRYFFEDIRGEKITEEQVNLFASRFSEIMREELTQPSLLIEETVKFIQAHHRQFRMHIVSGSDEAELRYLAGALGISDYFKSIHGSPATKAELIANLLFQEMYSPADVALIGDSMNDYEAAKKCSLDFFGYNSNLLRGMGMGYIDSFYPLVIS